MSSLPQSAGEFLSGRQVFCVGMKGTGMTSLAVMMKNAGAVVSGCDVAEVFMTDAILSDHGLSCRVGFSEELLPEGTSLVVHSSAWTASRCPVLACAGRQGISTLSYPQMLACLSRMSRMYIVAGTHGKTTTTGCAAWLLSRPSRREFPFFSVFGSAVMAASQQDDGALCGPWQGDEAGLIEACEYQDHFLSYRVRGALVTSVDHDHPDFFPTPQAVMDSFERMVMGIESGGFLLCCADDEGARRLAAFARRKRKDLMVHLYGYHARGVFGLIDTGFSHAGGSPSTDYRYRMSLLGERTFSSQLLGRTLSGDVAGGALLAAFMLLDRPQPQLFLDEDALVTEEVLPTVVGTLLQDAAHYPGCLGRAEAEMEDNEGILYLDDYAHHPAEIWTALDALTRRYPERRCVVAFSPHTASRTQVFFQDFVSVLSACDAVVIQGTYASARDDRDGDIDSAYRLYEEIVRKRSRLKSRGWNDVAYAPHEEEAVKILSGWLKPGDLCITMGAGNNRSLYREIVRLRTARSDV